MKITKEVKVFAEREFDDKMEKARNDFYAPFKALEEEIGFEFEELIKSFNTQLRELGKRHPIFKFRVSDNYSIENGFNVNGLYASGVSIERPKFKSPADKVKFMAELSMGQDLSSITELLEKYFA